jgi:magnesium-transporting ATPase (P-type)
MQNKLKQQTPGAIDKLQEASIRTIMVTGDNVLTAISVARSCHIVHPEQRIFLGDIDEKHPNRVVWKDFDMSDNALDPETLSPEKSIVETAVVMMDEESEHESPGVQTGPTGPSPMIGAENSPFMNANVGSLDFVK